MNPKKKKIDRINLHKMSTLYSKNDNVSILMKDIKSIGPDRKKKKDR